MPVSASAKKEKREYITVGEDGTVIDIASKKKLFQVARETYDLFKRIIEMREGDRITYEELTDICGFDVQGDGYAYLHSARKMAENKRGVVTSAIRNEGIARLDSHEIVNDSDSQQRKVRNAAKKGQNRLSCAEYSELSDTDKSTYNMNLIRFRTVDKIHQPVVVKAIKTKYSDNTPPSLTGFMEASLEAFRKSK